MDDKEKEKFGVIIDKSDQNKDDQSAVESTSDSKKEEETSNEKILQTSDNNEPENDEIISDHNNLINLYRFLKKIYLAKILFSPILQIHVISEKTLLKFGRPIVLLDWLRLYYFVNAK